MSLSVTHKIDSDIYFTLKKICIRLCKFEFTIIFKILTRSVTVSHFTYSTCLSSLFYRHYLDCKIFTVFWLKSMSATPPHFLRQKFRVMHICLHFSVSGSSLTYGFPSYFFKKTYCYSVFMPFAPMIFMAFSVGLLYRAA